MPFDTDKEKSGCFTYHNPFPFHFKIKFKMRMLWINIF